METKRICTKCGEANMLDSTVLKHEDVHDEEGNVVRLTYYKCVCCDEKNIVQIDDIVSMDLLCKLKTLIIKCSKKRIKNQTISPKDIKRREKLSKKLSSRRVELEKKYCGKRMYDENENIFAEVLTINGVCDKIC